MLCSSTFAYMASHPAFKSSTLNFLIGDSVCLCCCCCDDEPADALRMRLVVLLELFSTKTRKVTQGGEHVNITYHSRVLLLVDTGIIRKC